MRILIALVGGILALEAESLDTIYYVKGLIKEKVGISRLDFKLAFDGKALEDSKTLADYCIQNESTIHFVISQGGGIGIHIKTSFDLFTVLVRAENPTINDMKALIEEMKGIPVNEQRLVFSGKELDDGRTIKDYGIRGGSTLRLVQLRDVENVVDIAAVKARKAALAKDKGTWNGAEVGSKRAREDSSSAAPIAKCPKRDLMSCGVNSVEGVESFWDEEDFGLAWRRSRCLISPFDTIRFESISHRTLIESVANDCVRTLNVTAFLENKLKQYQDELSRAENEVKVLTERKGHLEDSLRKEKDTFKKLVPELDKECSTGTSFLESEVGRRHIATLERQAAKSAVDDFKKSFAINELVEVRAMSVYEDTVKECQDLLRKSERVSEDIIQLIGPQDKDEDELQDEDEDEDDEEEEL